MVGFTPSLKLFALPISQRDALRDSGNTVPNVLHEVGTLVRAKLQDFAPMGTVHNELKYHPL